MKFLNSTLPFGKYFGVPLKIHSFTLMFLLVLFFVNRSLFLLFLGTYFFVILHEYSHVFMGKKLGYKTEKVVLYPIGGMAYMNSDFRKKSRHEFLIALAGPLSNVALVVFFSVFYYFLYYTNLIVEPGIVSKILDYSILINIVIATFNLLPIFPFDGGRIFRSSLQIIGFDLIKSTKISYYLAIVLGTVGLFVGFITFNIMLCIIAVMAMLGARTEYHGLLLSKKFSVHISYFQEIIEKKIMNDKTGKITYNGLDLYHNGKLSWLNGDKSIKITFNPLRGKKWEVFVRLRKVGHEVLLEDAINLAIKESGYK